MKKTAIAIAVALAGFATVAQAAPKDNTWYTGAKLGWSQYHDTGFIPNNGPTHENQLGAGAFGGYQVNPYVGFEMGYDWLGRMPYKGDNINGAYKAQGVQLTAKLGYPITDDLDIYTRLGGMVWRADTKANVPGGASFKDHDTGVSPVFAGGVEYAITPEIATRLEYQWTNNIGDAHTIGTRPDNGMLSLGVSYRFGQGEAAPVVAPAPAPAPAAAPAPKAAAPAGATTVEAPMPGKILNIKVSEGQAVKFGEVVVIMEAMKMETEIVAPADGTVSKILVKAGDSVDTGAALVALN